VTHDQAGHVVVERDDGRKLVDVVKDHLGAVAVREVGELLRHGGVLADGEPGGINHRAVAGTQLMLAPGVLDRLRAAGRVTEPADVALVVVHEDAHLVVVDKPAGMHVHPLGEHRDGTLVGALLHRAGVRHDQPWSAWRPHPTHRLDRATSGLVLVAKHPTTQRAVDLLRADGQVRRTYRATVRGRVVQDQGVVDVPLGRDPGDDRRRAQVAVADGGQRARTRYRVVERTADTTVLEVELETGRTHQVRAHLAHLGHPLVGDELYDQAAPRTTSVAIALRAVRLRLPHPVTHELLDLRTTGT